MRHVLVLGCALALSACSSGGGGGLASITTDTSGIGSVSFQNYTDTTDYIAEAKGFELSYSYNSDGDLSLGGSKYFKDGRVIVDNNDLRLVAGNTDLTIDVTQNRIDTSSVDMYEYTVDVSTQTSNDETVYGFDASADFSNEFGDFGIWDDDNGLGNTGYGGVVVHGDFTTAEQIPTSGSGSYTGYFGGIYYDPSFSTEYDITYTTGDFSATVNFGTRAVSFELDNTIGDEGDNVSMLDFSKSFTAGSNWANGMNVSAATGTNNGFKGNVGMYLLGPNAEEVAGTFDLRGTGTDYYIGGFWGGQ